MSTWTHVVGCIRVDGLPQLGSKLAAVQAALGPICTFDKWDDSSKLPRGSEGGLQYQIIEYATGLPWLAIPIWGDLRDFDSAAKIENWWEGLLKELSFIRDAVLSVQVSGKEAIILTYKEPQE